MATKTTNRFFIVGDNDYIQSAHKTMSAAEKAMLRLVTGENTDNSSEFSIVELKAVLNRDAFVEYV